MFLSFIKQTRVSNCIMLQNSLMTEKNIHGQEGCLQEDGSLCRACCVLPYIQLTKDAWKPKGKVCPFWEGFNNGDEGCSFHNTPQKPWACVQFKCWEENPETQLKLLVTSHLLGDIGEQDLYRLAENLNTGLSGTDLQQAIVSNIVELREIVADEIAQLDFYDFLPNFNDSFIFYWVIL